MICSGLFVGQCSSVSMAGLICCWGPRNIIKQHSSHYLYVVLGYCTTPGLLWLIYTCSNWRFCRATPVIPSVTSINYIICCGHQNIFTFRPKLSELQNISHNTTQYRLPPTHLDLFVNADVFKMCRLQDHAETLRSRRLFFISKGG